MAIEEANLEEINQRGLFGRIAGYMRLTGPGYLQSAMTLGSGTAAACLLSGWAFGYKLLWVQPVAMLMGVIVFAAIAKQTLHNDERPYEVFWKRLHPLMALAWGLSALFASIYWNIPQYAIAVSSVADLGEVIGMGTVEKTIEGQTVTLAVTQTKTAKWIIGLVILAICIVLSWAYSQRGRWVRVYERLIKVVVWGMVLAFAWVAIATGIQWGEMFKGLVGFHIPSLSNTDGMVILLGGLSAAVGINMVFLYPYSLRQRDWGKEHEGLAQYDLISGMFIPFSIASILVIVATANTIGPEGVSPLDEKPASMVNLIPIMSKTLGSNIAPLVLGLGLFAMGLSSITVQMVAAGFTAVEILGMKHGGWGHRICMLLPAPVGIFGSVTLKPLDFAVHVSAVMVIFLPLVYIGFLILNNKKSHLGEATPRGGTRVLWNIGLALAIAVVTIASVVVAYSKVKSKFFTKVPAAESASREAPAQTAAAPHVVIVR